MTYRGNVDARYHRAVLFAEQEVLRATDWQEARTIAPSLRASLQLVTALVSNGPTP